MSVKFRLNRIGDGPITFSAFMKKHGLSIEVLERPKNLMRELHLHRYYAHFEQRVEAKNGPILTSFSGNGDTPEKAIQEYVERLAGELLVVDAGRPTRREIQCPNEWQKERTKWENSHHGS